MFHDVLHFPVETPENPFVAPVNIEIIEAFMNRVGYQGVIDKDFMNNVNQKKEAIQYPRFIRLIIADLIKKFQEISQRIKEDYHSIKDDIPLITIRQQKVVKGEKDDDDSEDRLEPGSHKDNPEHVDENDDKDEEKVDKEEGGEIGSLETRTEEMQTPIPIKLRSPRTILSSEKNITQEFTDTVPIPTITTSNTPHSK
ncbi:hypothetical protein Tco_1167390 [Tanacetum coccineum]